MECDVDADCPEGKYCRLICNVTCKTKCIKFTEKKPRGMSVKDQIPTSADQPFAAENNPFEFSDQVQRDESATPLTISEGELEQELKESTKSTVPPDSEASTEPVLLNSKSPTVSGSSTSEGSPAPVPPEAYDATVSSNSVTNSTVGEKTTIHPPSESPEPPGISDLDHQSGYLVEGKSDDVKTTVESELKISPTTEVPTTPPGSDSANDYEKNALGVSENDLSLQNLQTTPESEESTSAPGMESGTDGNVTVQGVPAEPLPDDGCLPPEVCEKNCGVYLDDKGCQICQCLWLSIPCETTSDCVEEGQFCDLGRCECMPGYVQDMRQSGICKRDETVSDEEFQKIAAEVHQSEATTRSYPIRKKRAQVSEKPKRMERLQWPGPCDRDSQCPPSLHCIQGDCWHLPDKPLKLEHLLDEEPKSFRIIHSEVHEKKEDLLEASTTTPLPEDQVFNFDSFPKPPTTDSTTRATEHDSDEEPKPPSMKPPEDDEDRFLGDFKKILDNLNLNPSTTSSSPPTRKFRTDLSENSFDPEESQSLFKKKNSKNIKNLSELIAGHHFESSKTRNPEIDKNDDLPEPKNRHPKVDEEGWKPMHGPEKLSHHAKFHQPPQKKDPMAKIYLDYTRENRMRKPVRVEMNGAKHVIRDECSSNRQCGDRYICCQKRWCDLSRECGKAKFCLPNCDVTKMTYLSSTGINGMPLIDLVYD